MTRKRDLNEMFREGIEKRGISIAEASRLLGFDRSRGSRIYRGQAKMPEGRRAQTVAFLRGNKIPEVVRVKGKLVPASEASRPDKAPPLTGRNSYRRSRRGAGWLTAPPVGPGIDLLRAIDKAAREGKKVALMVEFASLGFTDYPQGGAPDTTGGALPMFQPGFSADLPSGTVNGPINARRLLRELGSDPIAGLERLAVTVRKGSMPQGQTWVASAQGPHTITVHARP